MRQYETFELSFDGEALTENYTDIDLTATFTDASGSKSVRGFYAGDGTYKVRFLPETAGDVVWKVCGAFQGEGSEYCEPAAKGRHGIVRAEGTALRHADGNYFFSFGTTVYALAHQDRELTEQTFETLSENPFNKVRMCVFPKHYDYNVNDPEEFPFSVNKGMVYQYERGDTYNNLDFLMEKAKYWNVSEPNLEFWDAFEEKVKRLDQMGIQVDLILFHPYDRWGFSALKQEQDYIYLDYVMRRLSAFPNIWWSLANEYDLCVAKSMDDWYGIEEFVACHDPYHHLLSNHNCIPAYDFTRKNITHCSLQKRTMTLVPEYMKKTGKPVLYDECVYEGNIKQSWGSLSGKEMMNRFWKVTTQGGYCTHGEVYLDSDIDHVDDAVLWWSKGGKLTGESPKRIAYLRALIEEIGKPFLPYNGGGVNGIIEAAVRDPKLFEMLPDIVKKLLKMQPEMDPVELALQQSEEMLFAGRTADDSHILYYYGTDCFGRADIETPKEGTYKIEIIDAWNMTRDVYAAGVSGLLEVKLPGREYMAILCTRE